MADSRLTRRVLILGAIAAVTAGGTVAAVETGLIPGRTRLHGLLGINGASGEIPDAHGGALVTGTMQSQWLPGEAGWAISYPPGFVNGDALPVLISLHGFGGNHAGSFGDHLALDRFQARAVADGASPFAIASVDGGDSYWHRRRSGQDAGRMVVDEFVPLLGEHGLLTDRIGLFGWSMGGFGALHLASTLGPDRVAVVIAESPALWSSASKTAEGAFDDAEDFAATTPFGRQGTLDGIAVRVDCGLGDGFYAASRDYVAGFTTAPTSSFEAGGHDVDYWRRMAPAQLQFAATHLEG